MSGVPEIEHLQPPEWMVDALCAQTDPEAFFPEKGGSTREAKKTCLACHVRADCLAYALDHDERFGIWGGLSERERRPLRKRYADDALDRYLEQQATGDAAAVLAGAMGDRISDHLADHLGVTEARAIA